MNHEKFFNKLSIKSSFDVKTSKRLYYALIKVITEGLREAEAIKAPNLGKFKIVEHKARNIKSVRTKEKVTIPPTKVVKFEPDYKLKTYVKNM